MLEMKEVKQKMSNGIGVDEAMAGTTLKRNSVLTAKSKLNPNKKKPNPEAVAKGVAMRENTKLSYPQIAAALNADEPNPDLHVKDTAIKTAFSRKHTQH